MKFGDILKYDPKREGELAWRFMFIRQDFLRSYPQVLVVAIEPDDDIWVPGESIVVAGINELVPAHD